MVVLLDTSVIIDHLRGDERAREAMHSAAQSGESLAASVMTRVEVLAGMRPPEESATRRLLDVLEWVGVDEELAERAGVLANRYLRSHPGVDPVDYVIAATVDRLHADLWTRNVKHFPMFPELRSPY